MEYRQLGNTGLALSTITYGAFAIGGNMWGGNEQNDSINAIHASIEQGVTTIDTAPFYGFGLSEELVGKALVGKDRSKVQILTKFGLVWDGSNAGKGTYFFDAEENGKAIPVYKYTSKANIIKEVEESLTRLRTDYIDLLQVHWPDESTPIDETMEAMASLIAQGKIRAAGVCNYDLQQLQTAEKTIALASNQVPYSMLNRGIEQAIVPYAQQHNMGIIAYSPLERGLLTGKYFNGATLANNDHRNGYFGQFDAEKVKALIATLQPIAANKQVSVSQLVLRWTTLQPGITIVLAGARNAQQAVENAGAMNVTITNEEMQIIAQALRAF
ncbi:aryl-alcohol dehydrogenase-like predicted oxidoreductase [Chitinophaga skermanii]|uniref:Aryl-alcohol dehydrogenase-like predicted oxidoreductase n=1 Tax=Chitinophaga skermanii TaxID=331697 RepID=A0A327QMV0_9BACT|nr:aldo/keto reductase [Chitinophaga skermanii]RAJ05368.1 aryl-alcohol dehydrogenase-like predicted oxidoreductase [Chitinophaga skermanii]